MDRDLEEEIAELVAKPRRIARVKRSEGLVRLLEKVRPQRRVGLLAVPRAAIGGTEPLGDPYHRVERREIGEGLERSENEEARAPAVALRLGECRGAVRLEQRDGMGGRVARAEQSPIERGVESDGDGAVGRKGVPVQAARWDDVDAGGPALQGNGQRRRAPRTRVQRLGGGG